MTDPKQMLTMLQAEFERWEDSLRGLSEAQATASSLPNGWSVKDLTAHLTAWQQVSVARLEAARHDVEPALPDWFVGVTPDTENFDLVNAQIYETYRDRPWTQVHQAWQDGFEKFMALAKEIPEADVVDAEKYPWLHGYSLFDVLQGSYEHHHVDHFGVLRAWLEQKGV
ncbi:hypothetical protein BH24DEI2_BH24DEI2_00360 [soil metagenome]